VSRPPRVVKESRTKAISVHARFGEQARRERDPARVESRRELVIASQTHFLAQPCARRFVVRLEQRVVDPSSAMCADALPSGAHIAKTDRHTCLKTRSDGSGRRKVCEEEARKYKSDGRINRRGSRSRRASALGSGVKPIAVRSALQLGVADDECEVVRSARSREVRRGEIDMVDQVGALQSEGLRVRAATSKRSVEASKARGVK